MSDTDFFDTPYSPLEWEPPPVDDYLRPLDLPPLESDVFNSLPAKEYITEMYNGQAAYEEVFADPYPGLESNLKEKKGEQWELPHRKKKAEFEKPAASGGRKNQRLLSEIAQALADTGEYRNIDGRLYQYQIPCWRLRQQDEAMDFLFFEVQDRFAEYIDDVSSTDFQEIFEQLRCRLRREREEDCIRTIRTICAVRMPLSACQTGGFFLPILG